MFFCYYNWIVVFVNFRVILIMKKSLVLIASLTLLCTTSMAQMNYSRQITAESTWMEKMANANDVSSNKRIPTNSCIYETETSTVDGKIIKTTEQKRCHEEIPTGEKKDSGFSEFIRTPLGETLIVLATVAVMQRVANAKTR
jgi:hypothetical protein